MSTTNWAGNVTYRAHRIHQPDSVPQLRRLIANSRHLRALGTRHTFNTIADSPGDLVSLARLPSTVDIDPDRSTATVSAGMRYGELAPRLNAAGYALHNMGSLPHINVAGTCATGTHGSGTGNLPSAVVAVELIGPDGDLRWVERGEDTFDGSVLALGALGIVTRLTLDIQPTYQVAQHVYGGIDLHDSTHRLPELLSAGYSVSLFTDWGPRVEQLWVKRRLDPTDEPPTVPGAEPLDRAVHPVPGMPTEHCTEQFGVPGPWYERLPHFRLEFTPSNGAELQSEYLVPAQVGGPALRAVAELRDLIQPVLLSSEIRTVTADNLWLSPSYRRDSVAIHFTWIDDTPAVLPVVAAIEQRLARFDARPHWGKVFTTDPATLRAQYPRLPDFTRLMHDHDPDGKFRNNFTDQYLTGTS